VLAQADTEPNAEVVGVVVLVTDPNTFDLQRDGFCDVLTGLTPDDVYYLSESVAGTITATQPTGIGEVSKPVLIAATTTAGWLSTQMRGYLITAAGGGDVPWEDASPFFINGAAEFGAPYGPSKFAVAQGCLFLALTINPGSDGQVADFGVAVLQTIKIGFGDGSAAPCEITAAGVVDFYLNPTGSAFVNAVIPLA
jgi:hypothetical protein